MLADGADVLGEYSVHVSGPSWKKSFEEANMAAVWRGDYHHTLALAGFVQWKPWNTTMIDTWMTSYNNNIIL